METALKQTRIFFLCVPMRSGYLETLILEYLRRKEQVNTSYG